MATCCFRSVLSSYPRSLIASASYTTSMCVLKSPVITRWLAQNTADLRKSENSSRERLVVTGLTI